MDDELAETNRFMVRGKFERAREAFLKVLEAEPTNLRLRALAARLDAETGRTSFVEAEGTVRSLLRDEPGDVRLRTTAAILVARQGNMPAAIDELRSVAAKSADPYVHQTLAGLLHVDRATWAESWAHYSTALRSGPLASPCYRSAAYQVGRSLRATDAAMALQGTSAVERAVIRTRALGPVAWFLVVDAVTLCALLLRGVGALGPGLAVMALSTLLIGWAIYANALVCCRSCRTAWVIQAGLVWVLFAVSSSPAWVAVAVVALVLPLLSYRRRSPAALTM